MAQFTVERLKQLHQVMIARCTNKKHVEYKYYGKVGVGICPRWLEKARGFDAFCKDIQLPSRSVSETAAKYAVPIRIDPAVGYFPGNVELRTNMLEYQGVALEKAAWARLLGMKYTTLMARLRSGWSVANALFRPVEHHEPGAHGSSSRKKRKTRRPTTQRRREHIRGKMKVLKQAAAIQAARYNPKDKDALAKAADATSRAGKHKPATDADQACPAIIETSGIDLTPGPILKSGEWDVRMIVETSIRFAGEAAAIQTMQQEFTMPQTKSLDKVTLGVQVSMDLSFLGN